MHIFRSGVLLFILFQTSLLCTAQYYYPLSADKNVLNGQIRAIQVDSGISTFIVQYKIQGLYKTLVNSVIKTRRLNAINNTVLDNTVVWSGSDRAVYLPQLLKMSDSLYVLLAVLPLVGNAYEFNPSGPQLFEPWILKFDANLQLISAEHISDIGSMYINVAALGKLSDDKIVISISSSVDFSTTKHHLVELSSLNLLDTSITQYYIYPNQWSEIRPNKYLCSNEIGQLLITDSFLNLSNIFLAQVLAGHTTKHNGNAEAKYFGAPIYQATLDSGNSVEQKIAVYCFDTTKADSTSLLYVEPSLMPIYANQARLNLSVIDFNIYFGTNYNPCSMWNHPSTCTNEQVIRKVRNGKLIWMKTLGGDAGYYLNQVLATNTGIWIISLRNKAGENTNQYDVYYALLDTNGNDIGPVIPFTTKINEQSKKESISLSPNPATSVVNITTTFTGNYNLTITNQLGQIMHEAKNASNKIDVSKYAPGLYRFAVQHQGKMYVQMVVKQ
jgi:hypothetical protein